MTYRVVCSRCGRPLAASAQPECPQGCGRPIIEYDVSPAALACLRPQGDALAQSLARFWRYAPLLPLNEAAATVSLGEGATPLVDCPHAGQELGADRLYVKLEAANPTGSFKDRCAAVAIAKSLELGRPAVAIASAGNAAAAASAYAARPPECRAGSLSRTRRRRNGWCRSCSPARHVVAVKGGSVNDCSDLVSAGAERYGWYPVTTAAIHNLYQAEATRTIAFEIWEQSQYAVPDWIVAPVGGGGLLSGIARGWRELRDYGLTDRIPRLVVGTARRLRAAGAGCVGRDGTG